MSQPVVHPGDAATGPLRLAPGLSLMGEFQGTGFAEPRYLIRRGDGQVIQVSRLLYLVTVTIAKAATETTEAGNGAVGAELIAVQVSAESGQQLTADNVRYLVGNKLAPLGVVNVGPDVPAEGMARVPRVNLLLGLKLRGVLLRPRMVSAIGRILAWLHFPVLVAVILAGFAAFEGWLFGVHGAIGPLLGVLADPVLFLAVAGLTLASLLFHEFGHASACRYGGARPGVIGFGLYLIWPSLYTDVTDAYRLSRAGRLRTDFGGVYFNAIFILGLAGCYAATGQPVFLAAAFLDNFQILQQLFPLVRMDGYFILGDLAGIPDLLGLLGPIMASVLPGRAARRAGARARGLRRGPRVLVTAWVLVAVPVLGAAFGYTLWNLPALISTATRSFARGAATARAAFAAGHPVAGLSAGFNVFLLILPLAALVYLLARIVLRWALGLSRAVRRGYRDGRRRRAIVVGTAGMLAAVAGVSLAVAAIARPGPAAAPANANQTRAAAWVAHEVSPGTVVSCDPAACDQVRRRGFPAGQLKALGPATRDPLGSGVVIATPALRTEFGTRLATVYAPLVMAGFGSGPDRVEVRAVASGGAADLAARLSAQHASLTSAGRDLLRNPTIVATPGARVVLQAGHADPRLLAVLSVLSSQQSVRIVAFGDAPPGASSAVPLRNVQLRVASPADRSAIVSFLDAQKGTYRPDVIASARDAQGQSVVTVGFDAPDPLSIP
jgi:putative peptide zinc metalloprotease protein